MIAARIAAIAAGIISLIAAGKATLAQTPPFMGPSPWFDVTAWGAKCDGATVDTTAVQNALNAASSVSGTVFTPPGKVCVVASLSLDNFIGVKVIGGFGGNPLPGNTQSTWKFTGTCAPNACLSMRSTAAISFYNIELTFPNATAGPMVDLSHSSSGADTSLTGFHGVAFAGPSSLLGPIVLDQNTDEVTFDDWTTFSNASVFVEGPTTNAAGYSDKTVFDRVDFAYAGTAAIQNASVGWTIENSSFQIANTSGTCTPVLQYVNSYNNEQALLVSGNTVTDNASNCGNSVSIFSLPAVYAYRANRFTRLYCSGNRLCYGRPIHRCDRVLVCGSGRLKSGTIDRTHLADNRGC